jgi:hypothetical protein
MARQRFRSEPSAQVMAPVYEGIFSFGRRFFTALAACLVYDLSI